jgi:hypothetical protein
MSSIHVLWLRTVRFYHLRRRDAEKLQLLRYVTPAVRERLGSLAITHLEKIFLLDSRARIELFRHMIIKPNRDEAESAAAESPQF